MHFDEEKVLANVRQATTDDLLDRVTAYRAGMEPAAIAMIERELRERGVGAEAIADRREEYEEICLYRADGSAEMCSFCRKPAVREGRSWHKAFWLIPLWPRRVRYCPVHAP